MNFKEFLNESYVIALELVKSNGKTAAKPFKASAGDWVSFNPGTTPAKGKNKYNIVAGKLGKKKGNLVQIDADEEGGFWYDVSDLYVDLSDV